MIAQKTYAEKYDSGAIQRPVGERTEDFFKSIAEYYYGSYCSNCCFLGFGGLFPSGRSIKELRDRARGHYYLSQYQDLLDPVRDQGKRKGKRRWNISWAPLKVLPKFRNIVRARLSDANLSIKTIANSPEAQLERLFAKNYAMLIRQPETKMFLGDASVPDQSGFEGMSAEDIEITYKMGGIRLPVEIAMKDAIDKVLLSSHYEPVLKNMLIDDIVDINMVATDIISVNGHDTLRYVDPAGIIIGRSNYFDFRDCGFRGYVEEKSVTQIKMEAGDTERIEDRIFKVYKDHFYTSRNGYKIDYNSRNSDRSVFVLRLYFTDTDFKKYVTGYHKRGGRVFEPVESDFSLTPRMEKEGKKLETKSIEKLYKVSWVVGTDIVYDYGVVDYVVRKGEAGNKQIIWPMSVCLGDETSLIESCVGIDDDLQLANYKIRHLLAKIPPGPRMILYQNMISDSIKIDGEDIPISEVLADYQAEGIMVLDQTQQYGLPGEDGRPARPIDFIPSGIQEDFMIQTQQFQNCINNLRIVTGINEVADGSTTKTDILKSVMTGLQQATNSALKPHTDKLVQHYLSVCEYAAYRFKTRLLIDGDIDLGQIPSLQDYSRTVKLTKDMAKYDWQIYVEIETGEMANILMQAVTTNMNNLPPDSLFLIIRALQDGDLLKANFMYATAMSRAKLEAHQMQLEAIDRQTQGNQQAAEISAQGAQQAAQMKIQMQAQLAEMQAMITQMRDEKLHEQKKEIVELQEKLKKDTSVTTVRENNMNRLTQI